ncbi:MAG: hypothetical protein ACK54F_03910 [Planctomycetia bacterium]|jgi:hypothetical protein
MSRPKDQPSAEADTAAAPPPAPRHFLSSLAAATLWMAIWAGVAAVLLGAGFVPWLASDPARLSRLIAQAVPELQADVTIGKAQIGWSGPIVIEDIRVVPRNGARPPVSIKRIEGSHGLAAMLLSLGDLGRFRVEGLEADIVFDANRDSNLTGLVLSPPPATGDTGRAGPRKSPVRVRFEVDDAIAKIAGPWAPDAWVSDPTDIKARLAPSPDGNFSEWTVDRVQLLEDARLEANVAQGVLAYIAPVMADATRTSGRFSLKIDGATFPVGAPEAARLAGSLAMHEVDLGPGPLATNVMQSLPGRLQLPTSVRIADDSNVEFHLADRRVWHKGLEFGLPLAKPGQRLDINSSGSVGLDDKSLDLKLALPIPADLPGDRPLLASLAGKSISVGIGGMLGEPKVNFDGSIRATAGEVAAELIDRLRSGGQPLPPRPADAPAPNWVPPKPSETQAEAETQSQEQSKPAASTAEKLNDIKSKLPAEISQNPSADAVIDLVGGVLDEVAKRRAERAAAAAENPDAAPPPRRGRLLRRLQPPPAE